MFGRSLSSGVMGLAVLKVIDLGYGRGSGWNSSINAVAADGQGYEQREVPGRTITGIAGPSNRRLTLGGYCCCAVISRWACRR